MNTANLVNWREFDPSFLRKVKPAARKVGNPGKKNFRNIKNVLCAFDIETTRIPGTEQSMIYHWQAQIGIDRPTVTGRELWEIREFFDRLAAQLKQNETLLVFVHSLSYEFHFLRGVFEFKPEDVFALSPRKPVKARIYDGRIEFRCSYILTNMSLAQWTHKMRVEHEKKNSDEYDHNRVRFPWDPMTETELEYCRNDVLGLCEALQKQLEIYGDTLATVGLTSTSYVRRDVKTVIRGWSWNGIQAVQPQPEVYVALREAFRGGDVHANRFCAGVILKGVKSADRSSSYPEVCVNHEFPMGTFERVPDPSFRDVDRLIKKHRALLFRVRLENVRLKHWYDPCPYLSHAKVRGIPAKQCRLDNGRILYAPVLETTITDVDYGIIRGQYDWDRAQVLDLWETRYGLLPDVLRALIISYYEDKTKLKGDREQEVYYNKAKALLNSIYGLQAQDPCRETIVYDPDADDIFRCKEGDIPELLKRSRREPYGSYQWGVWVTAWARYELRRGIDLAGERFVYCDTDSVKYVGDLGLEPYNREKVRLSTANGAFADDTKGERHYMGVYENDGEYKRFITYGAKKYAYEDETGLHITIAGVGKKKGAQELTAAGGLDALKTGFVFAAAGGTEAVYNDRPIGVVVVDGHEIQLTPNIYLRSSTYTLGVSDDYLQVLQDADVVRRILHNNKIKSALATR